MRYASAAGRWVLTATVLGSGMAAIDATVVNIALPSIGREFRAPLASLEWVVTGYSLTLSAFVLLGGSLSDRWGRRRIFSIGVAWFSITSIACAFAPDSATLIVMRVLQGVGGALLTPGSLAIIEASFDRDDRGRAIGAWSGLGGVANAAGPLVGGYLIAVASWRWIFLINVPIGALVLLISARRVPESRNPAAAGTKQDLAGAATVVVTLAALSYGLIEGSSLGWGDGSVVAMLVVAALSAAAFVAVERRSPSPMLPLWLFTVRQFSVTNAATFVIYAALGGTLFLLPTQLQVTGGYTPLESGAALLPLTALMLGLSARSGRLASAIGPRLQMSAGPILVGAGLALLARAAGDTGYLTGVLPGVVVMGLGLATTVAPLTATALGSVTDDYAGLASAINNAVARLGGLIAVAVVPALAGITRDAYLHPAALAAGFRTAVYVAAGASAAAGVTCALGIRNPPREPRQASEAPHHHCAIDAAPLLGNDADR